MKISLPFFRGEKGNTLENMDKLKFYRITDKYINFLRRIDPSLLVNEYEARQRPYIGVILAFGIHQYFAPLSSYKPKKYDRVKNHTIHKVAGKNNKNLAVIKLNCMFPIIQTEIEYIDFEEEAKIDQKYADLLEEEYRAIIGDQEEIKDKARRLYDDVVVKKKKFFVDISSKIPLLEQEYVKFGK